MSAIDTSKSNKMFLKQIDKVKEANTQRCVRLGAITCIALAIIAYLERGFITERPACVQWNKEVQDAEKRTIKHKNWYESALDNYHDRAKLNCEWDWEHSRPGTLRDPEVLKFCSARNNPLYSIDKIPSFWKITYTQEDVDSHREDPCEKPRHHPLKRLPGMQLSCFAIEVVKTQDAYERQEKILNNTLADKPLLCNRVEKT